VSALSVFCSTITTLAPALRITCTVSKTRAWFPLLHEPPPLPRNGPPLAGGEPHEERELHLAKPRRDDDHPIDLVRPERSKHLLGIRLGGGHPLDSLEVERTQQSVKYACKTGHVQIPNTMGKHHVRHPD